MAAPIDIVFLTALWLSQDIQILAHKPETLAVVMDNHDVLDGNEFIQIINPPEVFDNGVKVTVEYRCNTERIVGVELLIQREANRPSTVYHRMWKCNKTAHDGETGVITSRLRKVKIRLPDDIGFRPGFFNRVYSFVFKSVMRAWIIDKRWFSVEREKDNCYRRSPVKVSYNILISPPYSRPFKYPYKACRQWYWNIVTKIHALNNNQLCPLEQQIIHAIQYPAALNGLAFAVYRKLQPYDNPELEQQRKASFTHPKFTVEIWLYIVEYCMSQFGACAISMHVAWDNTFLTPLILVDNEGFPQIEMFYAHKKQQVALKVPWKFPKHQWFKMVFQIDSRKWSISAHYGENYNKTLYTDHMFDENVFLDDTEGLFTFGGNDPNIPSFKGYIGRAVIYRSRCVKPEQMSLPNPYHPMFELRLSRREEKCTAFMTWIQDRIQLYKHHVTAAIEKKKCPNFFLEIRRNHVYKRVLYCPIRNAPRPRYYRIVNAFIRKSVLQGETIEHLDLSIVATDLFANATHLIEHDVDNVPRALHLLKQAACLGEHDAMYMLSVILNNGFMVKADEIQAQAYLMQGSLAQHRLSTLALGNKHIYGIDSVPYDPEQSYLYYKYVATRTRDDQELHKDTDVVTESIRLTDEQVLREQTDENGDIFLWLKLQAEQGVMSAQKRVSRALFWGAQGLKRNLNEALEIFRKGAEAKDPSMMYDYGIVMYRGQGPKQDKTEGMKFMKEAAKAKHPEAINALGWIALNERHYKKAAELFEEAFTLNTPDAGYYLGHLYMQGFYPGKPIDFDTAYWYYEWSATKGHIDSGVMYAFLNIKGTPRYPRSVYHATQWARHIAEMNPSLGMVLRKGLHAYRNGDMPLALFYYMMAAETGIEVGSFNFAWLCEANHNGIVASVEKDCQWRQYNLTIQRESHFVNSYSLIKMGDYFWYGCRNRRDIPRATQLYAKAAASGDPHALFNLAIMVEDGVDIPRRTLDMLKIPKNARKNNITLLVELYSRCKESVKTEAYLPCSMALVRVQLLDVWARYNLWMKVSTAVGMAVITWTTGYAIYHHITQRHRTQDLI